MRSRMQQKKGAASARVSRPPTATLGKTKPAANVTRRPQTRRNTTATDLTGAVEALNDPARHVGLPDGAGGTGFFGATGDQIGHVPSASTTRRAAAAENGQGISRIGSGNPRSEIAIGVEAIEADGITAAPG